MESLINNGKFPDKVLIRTCKNMKRLSLGLMSMLLRWDVFIPLILIKNTESWAPENAMLTLSDWLYGLYTVSPLVAVPNVVKTVSNEMVSEEN